MLSKVSQGESQLYGVGLPDRDSERVVEPRPQVAVCQQVEAQHGRQVGETPPPRRLHLHELQEQDRDECCPNLRLDRVLAGAHVVSAASTAGMSFLVHPSYTFSGGLSFQNAILDKSDEAY